MNDLSYSKEKFFQLLSEHCHLMSEKEKLEAYDKMCFLFSDNLLFFFQKKFFITTPVNHELHFLNGKLDYFFLNFSIYTQAFNEFTFMLSCEDIQHEVAKLTLNVSENWATFGLNSFFNLLENKPNFSNDLEDECENIKKANKSIHCLISPSLMEKINHNLRFLLFNQYHLLDFDNVLKEREKESLDSFKKQMQDYLIIAEKNKMDKKILCKNNGDNKHNESKIVLKI